MSVLAEISVPASDFALAAAFAERPELTLEVERHVAHPDDRLFPHVWAVGEPGPVESALAADPSTVAVDRLAVAESGTLFAIEWAETVRETLSLLLAADPVVLGAIGRRGRWTFRLRFRDHEDLTGLQERLAPDVLDLDLDRVHADETATADRQFVLTEKQREALSLALDAGYYEVPRQVTMTELADDLGISQQAFSKRLRRANATVTRHVLATEPGPGPSV